MHAAASIADGTAGSVDLREHSDEIAWAATRAPSYRNAQPWSFRVGARQVEVYADRSRSCPVADPDGRQLFLGLGAATFGIRLALARLGLRPVVGLSRDRHRPDLAAVVVAAGTGAMGIDDQRLHDELDRRRTVWTPFTDTPISIGLQLELSDRIRHEGVTPRWLVNAGTRRSVADLARRTAVDRLADRWLQQERVERPTATELPEPPPGLLVICTPSDHRADWLRAGQALHHALLAASAAGVSASFLGQVLEIPLLRSRLATDLDLPGSPQVMLGLGCVQGSLPAPTPRRPPAEVLLP